MKTIRIALLAAALAALGGALVLTQSGQDLFQQALVKEQADGDLRAAIAIYQRIARDFTADRTLAAKALVQMGRCYERLGKAEVSEARKAYERVVREFADQKDAAEQARVLLATATRERESDTGIAVQLKHVFPAGRQTVMTHVSSDGRYIGFTGPGGVWLHDLSTGQDRRVIETKPGEWAVSANLAPHGRQIAYTWSTRKGAVVRHELRIADVEGSGVRTLMADQVNPPMPKGWSPDGRRILILMGDVNRGLSHSLVSVADGSVQALTTRDYYSNGCFSPDGRYIVAYRGAVQRGGFTRVPGGLTLIPVDGSPPVPLFESSAHNWAPFWTPDGRKVVFLSDRSGTTDLWSIRMSNGRSQGEAELAKREAGSIDPDSIGFTKDGLLYYKTTTYQSDVYSADLDPATGHVISKPAQLNQRFVGSVGYPIAWSPDGQFLAYARTSRRELGYPVSKAVSFVVRSEKTGLEREIAPVPAFSDGYPKTLLWRPDGRSFLADDFATELYFHQIDVDTGQAKVFSSGVGSAAWYPVLSTDAKTLFYVQYPERASNVPPTCRLMRRDMDTGEVRELHRAGDVDLDAPSLSPDGRQLAFAVSDWNHEPNTFALMIMPTAGGAARELLRSKSFIGAITWTRDGRHVLIMRLPESGADRPGDPYQLWSVPAGGGEPRLSGLAKPGGFAVPADVALHPDGRRIAFSIQTGPIEELWVIKNLLSGTQSARK